MPELLISDFSQRRFPGETGDDDGAATEAGTAAGAAETVPYDYTKKDSLSAVFFRADEGTRTHTPSGTRS